MPAWEASRVFGPRSLSTASLLLTPTPFSAHVGNVLVHVLNGFLLFALLAPSSLALPLVGLFWLHPVQTEAVAYISGRSELLACLFVLLALLSLKIRGEWLAVLLVTLCGLCAIAAKEASAVPLIVWAPLTAVIAKEKPAITAMWLPSVIWLALGLWFAAALPSKFPLADFAWMRMQLGQLWHLLRLLVWPVGQSMEAPVLSLAVQWGALLATLGTLSLAVALRRRCPAFTFAVLWVLAGVAPRVLLDQPRPLVPEPLHEHHLYLSTVGLALAVKEIV